MSTLLALVSAGAGVAVVPRGLAAGSGNKIVMRALPPRSPLSEIGFAIRAADSNPLLARLRKIAQLMGRKTSEVSSKS